MINALQGTRMGRKVQSVEQVLEEAKGWTGADAGLETEVQGRAIGSIDSLEFSGPHPDRFKFRSISLGPGVNAVILNDLETSEGKWSTLLMSDLFGRDILLGQDDYIKISEGTHTYDEDQFQPLPDPIDPLNRLLPLRVQYWFLRAAWQRYNATGPDSTEGFVKALFVEYLRGGMHHGEQVQWMDNGQGKFDGFLYTKGWENDHPFSQIRELKGIPMHYQLQALNSGEPFLPALTSWLFDDPDPIRVSKVFGYAAGSPEAVVNLRINTPILGKCYAMDIDPNGLVINLTGNPNLKFNAKTLMASKQDFTPWVKP